jgi:heme exporter protein B
VERAYWNTFIAIVWKDLVSDIRNREVLSAMVIFALLVIVIFNFALEFQPQMRESLTSGILWVTFAFAGTLGLNRSIALEKEQGCLDGLLLVPVGRNVIFLSKMVSNFIFMTFVELLVLPLYSIFYDVNLFSIGFLSVIGLGSIGYVAVGTILASMAAQTKTRDTMLPILLFPVAMPILIASVKAENGFLQGYDVSEIMPWLNMIIVYDIVFIAIAFMVFDFLVED